MSELLSNKVTLRGAVVSSPVISHKVYGEEFIEFDLSIKRTSGYEDIIPVTVSRRLLEQGDPKIGELMYIQGQVRTYNRYIDGKNRLMITVFAQSLEPEDGETDFKDENMVVLEGFICRQPYYRVSPLGREIADLMLAVNRMYGKSDYVPCIAWGRNAKYARNLEVGQKIKIAGRIQSREYRKKGPDGELIPGIAREVSIHKIEEMTSDAESTPSATFIDR